MLVFPGVFCHQRTHQDAQQCASVSMVVPGPGPGWLRAVGTAQGCPATVWGPSPHREARGAIREPKALSGTSSPGDPYVLLGD